MKPLIINACLTGIVPQKRENPSVPITPQEIIADARRVIDAGAAVIHIHAREDSGSVEFKKEVYGEIIRGIRKDHKDVIISVTTSGRIIQDFSKRTEVLELTGDEKPDLASLILGSMNFPAQGVLNEPDMIKKIAVKMRENSIHPEWEVFEPGMLHYGKYLVRKGILEQPRWINIILGSLGTSPAQESVLSLFLSMLDSGWNWAATGVGRYQLAVNELAIRLGGHVRVGLEDSIYMDDQKTQLATNVDLVKRIVRLAKQYGRAIATPQQTRILLFS